MMNSKKELTFNSIFLKETIIPDVTGVPYFSTIGTDPNYGQFTYPEDCEELDDDFSGTDIDFGQVNNDMLDLNGT
jgi:hypothetical protein